VGSLCAPFSLAAPPDSRDLLPAVATTVQLPTFGVAIDAEGVLAVKAFEAPGGKLVAQRVAAAQKKLGGNVWKKSELRKVSLVRLEEALATRLAAGEKPDDIMRHLAGLQRLQYVFYLPDEADIVIAGPAEGWLEDPAGRAVGITSGKAVLELEDLAAALRTFAPKSRERPFVGCTIDPDPEALERLLAFQGKIPRVVAQAERERLALEVHRGTLDALGMASVRVFTLPANTHMAEVLVEADYRMKLMAVGLEQPPVKMPTFFSALGAPKEMTLQRWWFTPDYKCVRVAADGSAMELVGQGVQLQTEDKTIGPGGKLINAAARPSPASAAFAEAFTKNYPKIAERSAIYAQLRHAVDLLIAAAFIRQHDYYTKAGWDLGALGDEKRFAIETHPTPKQAPCAANTVWRGARLISPAGGGVSIVPTDALSEENLLKDEGGLVEKQRATTKRPAEGWWWD
jgi:hypothetical protein